MAALPQMLVVRPSRILAARSSGARAGQTFFQGRATAGQSTIRNLGGSVPGAFGGFTGFFGSSSAGSATIRNESAHGGAAGTFFYENSRAESASIFNGAALGTETNSITRFAPGARADAAMSENEGGKGRRAGLVAFQEGTSADTARITDRGMTVSGSFSGGIASFDGGKAQWREWSRLPLNERRRDGGHSFPELLSICRYQRQQRWLRRGGHHPWRRCGRYHQ